MFCCAVVMKQLSWYSPLNRSSLLQVFLRKGVLKICSKFTEEHPCRSAISIKLLCNFIEITLRHGCSPVNLLHIFTTPFPKSTSGRLLEIANNNEFTYQDAKDLLEMTYTRTNYKRTLESKFRSLLFRKCTKINQFCSELYSYQRTLWHSRWERNTVHSCFSCSF